MTTHSPDDLCLPRRPARTAQPSAGYVPPLVFSRVRLHTVDAHRAIVGLPPRGSFTPHLAVQLERADGFRWNTIRLFAGQTLDLASRALHIARTETSERSHVGDYLGRGSTLRVWVQRFDDGPVIFFHVLPRAGESTQRPMRIDHGEFEAFERALAWLREVSS